MKILVCIKQVPESNKVEVDPVTGVLKRDGAASKMNPYDLYALETAFRIREEVGGSVHVISMGPPQAQQVIREAFAMGADGGTLLSDRKFGGADVLATSYTLAQGIKSCGDFDLILRKLLPNELLLVLALGWILESFLQGITGFGVPVAVGAPLLIGIGMNPMWAVILPLLGQSWGNTFGTLAAAWDSLASSAGLSAGSAEYFATAFWASLSFLPGM